MSALDEQVKRHDETCTCETMKCYEEKYCTCGAFLAAKELEALRAENAKLSANNLDFIRANNEVGNLNADLVERNAKLRELLNKLPVCPTCYTPMEANEGYWWCPNNDCGQSPEDVSAETTKEAK